MDGKHVQPEKQVFAKTPGLHFNPQIAIGRGNDAHIHTTGALFPYPLELPFLQHAQQLALQLQGNLADFVEKQGAAIGQLEASDPVAHRPGEGAAQVAEELALEQFGRNRRAVDPDQRLLAAPAGLVNGAGDQLLAGAGLAVDQHVGIGGADHIDLPDDLQDRLALADDIPVVVLDMDFFLQVGVLFLESLLQCLQFGQGVLQLQFGGTTLGDIAKHHHRADDPTVADHRRAGELHREGGAVAPPEHLLTPLVHQAVVHRLVDRAVFDRVVTAIGVGVVVDAVDVLADHLLRGPPQHARAGRIDEGGEPFAVDAVDTVPHRTEQQLLVTLGFLEQVHDIAPFDQAAAHGAFGIGLVAMVALPALLAQHQDQLRLALDLENGGGDFQFDALAALAVATEPVGPAPALVHHRLGKDDQVRQLMAEQLADRQFQQFLAGIAEQLAGGDVQVAETVAIGIEQGNGFGAVLEHHVSGGIGQVGPASQEVSVAHAYEIP